MAGSLQDAAAVAWRAIHSSCPHPPKPCERGEGGSRGELKGGDLICATIRRPIIRRAGAADYLLLGAFTGAKGRLERKAAQTLQGVSKKRGDKKVRIWHAGLVPH